MDYKTYINEIQRTVPNLGSELDDAIHMSMGISTEAAELLDVFKKALAYNKPIDKVNVEEEFGDLFWYTFNLMRMFGFDFEAVLEKNVNKLYARYPKGFNSNDAINRNLDNERKVLTGTSVVVPLSEEELEEINSYFEDAEK